jgi:hypothetical protein
MTVRRRRIAALVLLALPACYRSEDAFIRRVAKLACVNARECDSAAFDEAFDSMSDCRDEAETELRDELDSLLDDGCEYVAENGRECIHATYRHRKDCGEVSSEMEEACDAVYVCPRGAEREDPRMSMPFDAVFAPPVP